MGIIDRYDWALACDDCGSTDNVTALEKGYNCWVEPDDTSLFKITVEDGKYGPSVTAAVCKLCGKAASVRRI